MTNWNVDSSWSLFLDRDGVINERIWDGYVLKYDQISFRSGSLEAISKFSSFFSYIFVVTNQQCVSKKLISIEELDTIHCNMLTEIELHNGKVTEILVEKMKLGELDQSGRRSPITTGETFSLNVDMVIKAAGQMPYQELVSSNKLENNGGKLKVSNNQTNLKGVFAGGDCVNGGKEVVDAVQAGKDGAFEILKFLSV